jgi:type VI protein secretion system component VasF
MEPRDHTPESDRTENREQRRMARMLFWVGFGVGVAALGTALAYAAIRIASTGRQDDPTTARIQELIDEANSLLKALDEQRHSA